jgi:Helix-turn-helix domain
MDGLPPAFEGDRLLTTEQAAAILRISPATLVTWRSRRSDGPPYIVLCGRLVRYRLRDLLGWMARQERTNTHDPRRPTDPEPEDDHSEGPL